MHDYWNDPPEIEEMPECCGDYMNIDETTGDCFCETCGKRIEPIMDPDPELFLTGLPDDYFKTKN